ncbi:MAG: 16S rRNA (guanine(527)-N(7))-methyltransferase RsmG [Jannaschia helgolandensis]|uniref:Ribosomal RNA small subunit methyltransferase G n=1 Tax=Jannaschia helgolandensis TaxID=188906 RepID=A0A1H7GZH5_9RHOB|nr:16S rRNA (guanine(527)-N(7))-methyltransferase RsmG [Jannaschia helgolandensis]SEK41285.1 16S rRNA (guanine527-N7)-methyltransferase [Jannaschia helgolandensis]
MTDHRQQIVSRETQDVLEQLENLVRKWSPRINIVSKASLRDLRRRHIEDSLEIANAHRPETGPWLDIGSGGGFPGLVVAACMGHQIDVVLVESDARKCAFLHTVRRELGLNVRIINGRIERIPPINAHVISARAVASLSTLFNLAKPHAHESCHYLFPKGRTWREEVLAAREEWVYDLDVLNSQTDEESVILHAQNLNRA